MNMNSHFDEANESGVEFLLTDLDAALTFMDIAETSGVEQTVRRNLKNARKAYDTVLVMLQRLTLDAEQRNAIEGKLALLRRRLKLAGSQF